MPVESEQQNGRRSIGAASKWVGNMRTLTEDVWMLEQDLYVQPCIPTGWLALLHAAR